MAKPIKADRTAKATTTTSRNATAKRKSGSSNSKSSVSKRTTNTNPRNRGAKPRVNPKSGDTKVVSQRSKSGSKDVVDSIFLYLSKVWEVKVRKLSDDYIVGKIIDSDDNMYKTLSGIELRRMRTIASLGGKIKTGTTLVSDLDKFKEFLLTQQEPVYSDRYVALLRSKIKEVFGEVDWAAIRREADSPFRKRFITPGASYPAMPAPSIPTEGNRNLLLLNMIAYGQEVMTHTWMPATGLEFSSLADGKCAFVPKNYKGKRMITMASREIVDKQIVVSNAIRDIVTKRSKTSRHIIQFDDQSVQHSFLKKGYCTIDLSSASDRVYISLLERVWPEFLENFGDLLPKTILGPDDRVYKLNCAGTQGFPLTFTLMAVLVGLATECASWARYPYPSANYGDDVVVHEKNFSEVYSALSTLGFAINHSKTHTSASGFIESCGVDMYFSKRGLSYNITPIHLRGYTDVEVIEFTKQMLAAGIIEYKHAIAMLRKLDIMFYAFPYRYAITEFHLPFGDEDSVDEHGNYPFISNKISSRPLWDGKLQYFYRKLPAMADEIISVRGLNVTQSKLLLQLLEIHEQLKEYTLHLSYSINGGEPAQHRFMGVLHHKLYDAYSYMVSRDIPLVDFDYLLKQYGIECNTAAYFIFVIGEYRKYISTSNVVKFSTGPKKELFSDVVDRLLGIKPRKKESIYRYTNRLVYKSVSVPSDQKRIDH